MYLLCNVITKALKSYYFGNRYYLMIRNLLIRELLVLLVGNNLLVRYKDRQASTCNVRREQTWTDAVLMQHCTVLLLLTAMRISTIVVFHFVHVGRCQVVGHKQTRYNSLIVSNGNHNRNTLILKNLQFELSWTSNISKWTKCSIKPPSRDYYRPLPFVCPRAKYLSAHARTAERSSRPRVLGKHDRIKHKHHSAGNGCKVGASVELKRGTQLLYYIIIFDSRV